MNSNKKPCRGIIMWTTAGILTLVALIVYQMVERTFIPVTILLTAGAAVTAAGIAVAVKKPSEPANFAAVLTALLSAFAAVYGFLLMIDPITWVATALEPFSILYTFIAFEAIMAVTIVLNIAAAFMGTVKENADE